MMNDAELSAAIAGDEDAIDAVAEAWLSQVYVWCHRLGGPRVDAEDAAHEVLIVMCRRIRKVRTTGQFPAWLFGITRRVIANHRRRAWVRRWVPGVSLDREEDRRWSPLRTVEAAQTAEAVWAALEGLAPVHREVLVLIDLEERSGPEVSELIGIPVGTVKSRLRVARKAFREAMRDEMGDEWLASFEGRSAEAG
ncbi:MAG: RNA polymerase sigma factor [Myxococcota bacterium]